MAFGMSDSEPSPAPFKFQSTSPAQSPVKSSIPKSTWDDLQSSNAPHNPFVFGAHSSNQQNVPPPKGKHIFVSCYNLSCCFLLLFCLLLIIMFLP